MIRALIERNDVKKASTPNLFRQDLHARNIFVSDEDPTQITSIIDWQSCSIEPAWHYSHETPDFCTASIETGLPLSGDDGAKRDLAIRRLEKDVTLCRKMWEITLHAKARELFVGRVLDQDILHLLHYAPQSWKLGNIGLRLDLLAWSRRWSDELGMAGEYPYRPTREELERYAVLQEDYDEADRLKERVQRTLNVGEEGWVPINRWAETQTACKALYAQWLEEAQASGGTAAVEKAKRMWPWDGR